jgi:hypothetical protein
MANLNGAIVPIPSAGNGFAVTPSDSTDLDQAARGLYVGTAGDVALVTLNGDSITLKNLSAGVVHPIAARRILSTGTTAVNIVGLL